MRPYVERIARSELFAVMTTAMATLAGSLLVAYTAMLGANYAGHLPTASFLPAPGGLVLAKVMIPGGVRDLAIRGAVRVRRRSSSPEDPWLTRHVRRG